ncbi:hypothetical protein N9U67_00705 [bacterium]|nr:hypothetical protein [bacterium]
MQFILGISGDLLTNEGNPCFGVEPLEALYKEKKILVEWMDPSIKILSEKETTKYDAILLNSPRLNKESINPKNNKVKIVSRFGVGYDSVDLDVLKKNKIILTNTPNAIRRPVAVASLTMILSLSGKLMIKDNLVRKGLWNERTNHMGVGLTKKTLGIVGFGGIGREFVKISKDLFKNIICYDPFVGKGEMENLQVHKVDFDQIAKSSDFLVILCDLNEKTRGMIDSTFLNKMKNSSYLINLSRGPVVNENDLIASLKQNKISGAGLDVMTNEPIEEDNELLNLKNIILTPHSLCWTDECFNSIATEAISSILNYFNNKKISNRVI